MITSMLSPRSDQPDTQGWVKVGHKRPVWTRITLTDTVGGHLTPAAVSKIELRSSYGGEEEYFVVDRDDPKFLWILCILCASMFAAEM
jgi:hypothetical protein